MSPRQYTMIGEFIAKEYDLEELKQFNQVTLGSLIYRKWVKQKGEIITITMVGQEAYYAYGSQNILRKNFAAAFSRYIKDRYHR